MKILMVCLGNICRSPLAEGILRHKVEQHGLNWKIDSAGTGSWHIGEAPDKRSIAIAKKHGIDISGQRARQFSPYDFERFDHIYVMDSSNYQDVLKLANSDEERQKVRLILNHSFPGMNRAVPDPYWNDNGFEEVFQLLDEVSDKIIEVELKQLQNEKKETNLSGNE